MEARSSSMAGPPRPNPEAEAVPFLCGAHDGPDAPHPGKTRLDQAVSGLEALVPLCELVVVGLQALFELAVCPAEQQSARDCAAHLGIERRKPCPRGRGTRVIHAATLPSCALPNSPCERIGHISGTSDHAACMSELMRLNACPNQGF
jgi:hypothetical protein